MEAQTNAATPLVRRWRGTHRRHHPPNTTLAPLMQHLAVAFGHFGTVRDLVSDEAYVSLPPSLPASLPPSPRPLSAASVC